MSGARPGYVKVVANGGEVIVPSSPDDAAFDEAGKVGGAKPPSEFIKSQIRRLRDEASADPRRLVLGLYGGGGPHGWSWLPRVLFVRDEGPQRVFLEALTCGQCGWEGLTANPTVAELYVDVPDDIAELRKAAMIPKLPCPRCGAVLPRHAIWIDPGAK